MDPEDSKPDYSGMNFKELSFLESLHELYSIVKDEGAGLSQGELRIRHQIATTFLEESLKFDLNDIDPTGKTAMYMNEFRQATELLGLRIEEADTQ